MRAQRGLATTDLVIGLAILLLVAAAVSGVIAAVHHYNKMLEDNVVLKADNKVLTTSLADQRVIVEGYRVANEIQAKIDAARKGKVEAQQKRERKADETIRNAVANDPAAKSWYYTPVPGVFVDSLRAQFPAASGARGDQAVPRAAPEKVDRPNSARGNPTGGPTQRPAARSPAAGRNPLEPVQR